MTRRRRPSSSKYATAMGVFVPDNFCCGGRMDGRPERSRKEATDEVVCAWADHTELRFGDKLERDPVVLRGTLSIAHVE